MKHFRHYPIEFHLASLSFLFALVFMIHSAIYGFVLFDFTSVSMTQESFFGGRFLFLFFNALYFFIIFKVVYKFCNLFIDFKNKDITLKVLVRTIVKVLLPICFWFLLFFLITMVFNHSLGYIFKNTSVSDIEFFSNLFMKTDHLLFGAYPSFWFQDVISNNPLGYLTVFAYKKIVVVISLIMFFALLCNTYLLRKFIIAFVIAGFIGLPFWIFMPAISPQSMYLENILNTEIPNEISLAKNAPIEKHVLDYLPIAHRNWVDPKGESFAVSTFPSMHVAWGTIVTVIGVSLYAPLAFVLLPWWILNTLGTMTTFEHYGVDVIAGMLLAILSLYMAKRGLEYEKKYFNDKYNLLYFWHSFEIDKKNFFFSLKKKLKNLFKKQKRP